MAEPPSEVAAVGISEGEDELWESCWELPPPATDDDNLGEGNGKLVAQKSAILMGRKSVRFDLDQNKVFFNIGP
jgi:hypothetical protein